MTELSTTTDLQRIVTGLESFDKRKQSLTDLADSAKSLNITSIDDKDGYKAVCTKRKALKSERVQIEKEGKAMRDIITPVSKHISAKEKELVAIIAGEEERLAEREEWYESELAAIKAEEERKENQIVQDRIDQLAAYGMAIDFVTVKGMNDDQFNARLTAARTDFEVEQKRIEDERIAAEKAKQEEEERLAKTKAEQEAEAARLEAIQKQQEEKELALKAEQEKIEAERRAIEEEKEAIERDRIQAAQREENRKREEELEKQRAIEREIAIKEAADRASKEERERIERERIEEEERTRETELSKTDKEKFGSLISDLSLLKDKYSFKSKAYKQAGASVSVSIEEIITKHA